MLSHLSNGMKIQNRTDITVQNTKQKIIQQIASSPILEYTENMRRQQGTKFTHFVHVTTSGS